MPTCEEARRCLLLQPRFFPLKLVCQKPHKARLEAAS
jgi:hypothetical protein